MARVLRGRPSSWRWPRAARPSKDGRRLRTMRATQ